jgi:hypothetical protein
VAFRASATVSGDFDLRAYPFDRHELRLNFEFTEPAARVRFVADEGASRIADFSALRGWRIGDPRLIESTYTYDTTFGHPGRTHSNFSRVTLTVPIERHRSAMLVDQFPGFAVCLVISVLIYLVRWDQLSVRVGMVTSAIFATVGNRYTLNAAVGTQGGFGLVDEVTLIAFASILTALSVSLLVFNLGERHGGKFAWRVDRVFMVMASALWFTLAGMSFIRVIG